MFWLEWPLRPWSKWNDSFYYLWNFQLTENFAQIRMNHKPVIYLWNFINNIMAVNSLSKRVNQLSHEKSHNRHSHPIRNSRNCAHNHEQNICWVCECEQFVKWNGVLAVIFFSFALFWILLIVCISQVVIQNNCGIARRRSLIWTDVAIQTILLSHVSLGSCNPSFNIQFKILGDFSFMYFKASANK